jgi:murein DD-endopeptidase MepM/ murein hydrolase activator NlpD
MNREQRRFRQVAVATALVGALGAVTAFGVAPLGSAELPPIQTVTEAVPLSVQVPDSIERFIQTETIRRGDTLAVLLARMGASDSEFLRFVSSDPTGRKALQMRAGRTVQAEVDSLGRVQRFTYRLGGLEDDSAGEELKPRKRIEVQRDGERLVASEEDIPLERSVEVRSVEIRTSLFAATDAAGIPEAVAIKVADIFGGDVDFTRDLRKGDRLRVVYETVREEGSFEAPTASRVLAIELLHAGKTHEAFWFERDGRGEYFTRDGQSQKRAFLRSPLEFSRVTSGFTESRLHPILRDWRAHRGVDFAAPVGTRVLATADGTVHFVGQQRGYGNVVVLRHRGERETVYAHLQGFADGIRVGARISQGQDIGAVGMTGWTTGPHLHYEVRVNGDHVDPMTVALPDARPLDGADRQRLAESIDVLRGKLAQLEVLRVARFQ